MNEDFDRGRYLFLGGPLNGHFIVVQDHKTVVTFHEDEDIQFDRLSATGCDVVTKNITEVVYYKRRHVEYGDVFATRDAFEDTGEWK